LLRNHDNSVLALNIGRPTNVTALPSDDRRRAKPLGSEREKSEPPVATDAIDERDLVWSKFTQVYPSYSEAGEEAIYALPIRLIEVMERELSGILDKKDFQFERDLTAISGLGFAFQRPIVFSHLAILQHSVADGSPARRDIRHDKSSQKIRELMAIELQLEGRSDEDVNEYFRKRETLLSKVRERAIGFAGWLLTYSEFRNDRDRFREKWGSKISAARCFPAFPVSYFGEALPKVEESEREFFDDYICLYRRWCLDTFATWDLPIPMRSDIAGVSLYPLSSVNEAGVVMFVPWYLIRFKDIALRDVVDLEGVPTNVKAWVDGDMKNWGADRFSLMLELYCYVEMGLMKRYRSKLQWGRGRIDQAINIYLRSRRGDDTEGDSMAETVKKTRLKLNELLSRR
jgi:hypothetical protein